MRIVMMGTGPFAVPTFRDLLAAPHETVALVTRPPRAQPRRQPPPNPMREEARAMGVRVELPERINDPAAVALLHQLAADLFVVCDYGQILSPEALSAARWGGINLHGSLLPAYRGAAPIPWAIYDGREETGVSVIHMTPRLDAGPILAQRQTPIQPGETAPQLERRLAELGVEAVREALGLLAAWDGQHPLGRPQDAAQATPARRLQKSDGQIDWQRSSAEIARQVRAFQPWPGAYSFFCRAGDPPQRVLLEAAAPLESRQAPEIAAVPGALHVAADRLLAGTGQGWLVIEQLHPASRKSQSGAEFARGYRLRAGDRFANPAPAPTASPRRSPSPERGPTC